MKVAIITDTHFGARGDSLPMLQSMQRFYDNVFFPTLDKYNISRVLHGGDYVDRRKYINYQTAQFIRNGYRAPLRARGIIEDVIVGNHDIFFKGTTELNAIQELYEDDPTVNIYTEPAEIEIDGTNILLLPWVADNNRDKTIHALKTSNAAIVLGHLEISGFQMHRGMTSHEGFNPDVFDRFELVMSGHYHHKSQTGRIHYLGAPYAMIWSDYRDPRGFHIFDTTTRELEFIENPYSLFARLVYDDAGQKHSYVQDLIRSINAPDSPYRDAYVKIVVKTKEQPYWFDLMMDALYKVGAQDVIVVDDIIVNDDDTDDAVEGAPDVDTLTLMREYVDTLTISCDKDELNAYLRQKYHEAIAANHSSKLT